jgi:hypothetical protein
MLRPITADASISLMCSACGYGISVRRQAPACPMCQGTDWEPGRWRPFTSLDDAEEQLGRGIAQATGEPSPAT